MVRIGAVSRWLDSLPVGRTRQLPSRTCILRGRLAARVNGAAAREPGAAQDQSGAVRLGDIKEEARARRSPRGASLIRAGGQSQRRTAPFWSGKKATAHPWISLIRRK
ncbi:hypothetical protein GCM10028796_04170 [Ramlibacter monticola]